MGKLAGNQKFEMPIPCFNIINGGKHAGNSVAFQEFMLFPVKNDSFKENLRMGSEIYHSLKRLIKE